MKILLFYYFFQMIISNKKKIFTKFFKKNKDFCYQNLKIFIIFKNLINNCQNLF